MDIKKPRYKIEDWGLSKRSKGYILVGRCPTHPKWLAMSDEERHNNSCLNTTKVILFDFNNRVAETLNSVYELGSIDPIWAEFMEQDGILISSFNFDERT